MPAGPTRLTTDEPQTSVVALVHEALLLGVSEASRRLSSAEHALPSGDRRAHRAHVAGALLDATRLDQPALGQIVKEVWSRGGISQRRLAARVAGHVVGAMAPHRALALARELALMSSTPREADLVGEEALRPLVEPNPLLVERMRTFLRDPAPRVRRAALRCLVVSGAAGFETERVASALLELAPTADEAEQRLLRAALRELTRADARAVERAITAWAETQPARDALGRALLTSCGLGPPRRPRAALASAP